MIPRLKKSRAGSAATKLVGAVALVCIVFSFSAPAQEKPAGQDRLDDQVIVGIPQRPGKAEPESATEDTVGLPYSQVLRDTEPPYENLFRNARLGGRFEEKIGVSDLFMQAQVLRGPRFSAPLFSRGIRPEDADFKLGRFYLDIRSLSGGLIYSDNVFLREKNERDGVVGIVRLTMAAILQVTENLRIATYGTVAWLPFRGEIGIAGFGLKDPFAQFEAGPVMQTQVSYDLVVGQWRVEVVDEFRIRHARFGAIGGFELFNGERFDEEDRAGRFVFADRTKSGGQGRPTNGRFESFFEARNLIGAVADRLLPTETRMEIGGYHSDHWYYNTGESDLPTSRDSAFIRLISERETLRFKPFALYRVSRRNSEDWDQEGHVGFSGPVSENIRLRASLGYFEGGNSDRQTYLARVRLRHAPGPLTFHQLEFHRGVTEPDGGLETSWYYLLRQVMGPDLSGELFAFRADFEDLRGTRRSGTQWQAGSRVTYNLGLHASLRASGIYTEFDYNGRNLGDYTAWIGRVELFHRLATDFHMKLIYQYRTHNSDADGDSFDENLVGLHFVKYF